MKVKIDGKWAFLGVIDRDNNQIGYYHTTGPTRYRDIQSDEMIETRPAYDPQHTISRRNTKKRR